ncbi:MAG: hypothetical protein V4521_16070 [Pseudomonadota bacterium]
MSGARDPAAGRFAALQLARLSGAIFVLLGALLIAGKPPTWLAGIPGFVGYILAAIGLFEFFALPRMLARKWKSLDQ